MIRSEGSEVSICSSNSVALGKIVENIIAFDKGAIYYEIEEIEDHKENLDWWVITPAEMVW